MTCCFRSCPSKSSIPYQLVVRWKTVSPSHHTVDFLGPFCTPSLPFSSHKRLVFTLEPLSRISLTESKCPGLFLKDSGLFQGRERDDFQVEAKTLTGREYPTVGYCLGPRSHHFTRLLGDMVFPSTLCPWQEGSFLHKASFLVQF